MVSLLVCFLNKVKLERPTSALASASHVKADTAKAALLCTLVLLKYIIITNLHNQNQIHITIHEENY